jgi:hypothetical protein
MLCFRRAVVAPVGLSWLLAAAAVAQPAPGGPARPAAADPADPAARVPPIVHVSSLSQYRRLGEEPAAGWRESNERVARIGGWRQYAKEAASPSPAAPAPGASHPKRAP